MKCLQRRLTAATMGEEKAQTQYNSHTKSLEIRKNQAKTGKAPRSCPVEPLNEFAHRGGTEALRGCFST